MVEQDVEGLARKTIEAFNTGDWETTHDLFGPGFLYDETGTGRHLDDVEEVMAALHAWKAAFPDAAGRSRVSSRTLTPPLWRSSGGAPTPARSTPAPEPSRRRGGASRSGARCGAAGRMVASQRNAITWTS
jgi:hypothetical protein